MSYWKRLARHPGLGIAAGTTALFAVAGGPTLRGVAAGVLASLCFWAPVLATAASQPAEPLLNADDEGAFSKAISKEISKGGEE